MGRLIPADQGHLFSDWELRGVSDELKETLLLKREWNAIIRVDMWRIVGGCWRRHGRARIHLRGVSQRQIAGLTLGWFFYDRMEALGASQLEKTGVVCGGAG